MTNPKFLSLSMLRVHDIVNNVKEGLGKIEDILIDLENDIIAYAVLFFGGFL